MMADREAMLAEVQALRDGMSAGSTFDPAQRASESRMSEIQRRKDSLQAQMDATAAQAPAQAGLPATMPGMGHLARDAHQRRPWRP